MRQPLKRHFYLLVIVLSSLTGCGAPTETAEAQAIRLLQAALPASTREAQGLPHGGWVAQATTNAVTVTLPLNVDPQIEQGLRTHRAALVRGAAQLYKENTALDRLVIVGTLPYGAGQTEAPMLVGEIRRADVATWDGASDQLGIWQMTVP